MSKTLELFLEIERIMAREPQLSDFYWWVEYDEDGNIMSGEVDDSLYDQATKFHAERLHERLDEIYAAADEGQLPDSAKEKLLHALRVTSERVEVAQETQAKLIGLAIRGEGLSLRSVANATGLNPKTVSRRASDKYALEIAIEFKKAEIEELEQLVKGSAEESGE